MSGWIAQGTFGNMKCYIRAQSNRYNTAQVYYTSSATLHHPSHLSPYPDISKRAVKKKAVVALSWGIYKRRQNPIKRQKSRKDLVCSPPGGDCCI